MSKPNSPKRKVVVTSTPTPSSSANPKARSFRTTPDRPQSQPMVYDKHNYYWMLLGVGLIALGMILMSGGQMPGPDVWDDSIIYSWRRTVLAPAMILAGLGVEIYAIFKR
jgi:hypothetical protein